MTTKQKLVIFEGADCSGKSTLIETLKAKKSFKDVELLDRSTISERVYAMKFNRTHIDGIPLDIKASYWEYWFAENKDVTIVLCNPEVELLAKRAIDKKECFCRNRSFTDVVQHLYKDKLLFEAVARHIAGVHGFRLLEIDTSQDIDLTIQLLETIINA